jgi:hypothetical protein
MALQPSLAGTALLIHNERTKLRANAWDRASTALGAGSLWPLYNLHGQASWTLPDIARSLIGLACFAAGCFMLHYVASRTLQDLRDVD